MVHLTAFYWGWLLASLLLGLAMGWISVVQHGEGVSRKLRWGWRFGGGAGRQPRSRVSCPAVPATGSILAWSCSRSIFVVCAVGSWLRNWVVSRSAPAA